MKIIKVEMWKEEVSNPTCGWRTFGNRNISSCVTNGYHRILIRWRKTRE